MINVNNINKYYNKGKNNEIHVINNTSIVLPDSGLVTFLGQSGSGKTTLINVVAGLDKAKGDISYDNEVFHNYKAGKIDKYRRENIGYIFQNYNLLPNYTVYENLSLALELIGITNSDEVKERIDYVLDSLKIKKFKNRLASNLSGGQMQRVSIARALIKDSKIIIADEPTGNLDSENTIEVMNILKAISKTRLVILVTHDRKNAEFYSDRIVEIKDGSIIDDKENDEKGSLDNRNSNKIYLKDLENKNISLDNINVSIYTEKDDALDNISIKLVKSNGMIYLSCEGVNYLTNESKVKLIDDNYKDITKEDTLNFVFEPKPFERKKAKKDFKSVFVSMKEAFQSFFQTSKKMKALNVGLFFIGAIIAVFVLMISITRSTDSSKFSYSNCAYCVDYEYDEWRDVQELAYKAIDEGLITDTCVNSFNSYYGADYYLKLTDGLEIRVDNDFVFLGKSHLDEQKIISGSKNISNDNEVVITKKVANEIIANCSKFYKLSFSSLIGKKMYAAYNPDLTIIGITDSTASNLYFNIENAENLYASQASRNGSTSSATVGISKADKYTIVKGRDVENDRECLVNINTIEIDPNYDEETGKKGCAIGEKIEIGHKKLEVVGFFKTDAGYYEDDIEYIVSDKDLAFKRIPCDFKKIGDITLSSGRMPEADDEIVVNEYIDERMFSALVEMEKYKIVGYYKADTFTNIVYFTENGLKKLNYESNRIIITTKGDELTEFFKENGYKVKSQYEYECDNQLKDKKKTYTIATSGIGVVLALVLLNTFFVMRSRMISRIYEIGVLREIGAKKGKIYKKFLIEILILTTFTVVLGYAVTMLFFGLANRRLGFIISMFRVPVDYFFLGILGIYVLNVIIGLLPIFTLLRKTPAEIVAKYDI